MSEAVPPLTLSILVVDDEINIRKTLAFCLEDEHHHVTAVSNPADALAEAARRSFDLAFVDLRLGAQRGLDLVPQLLAQSPWMKIVVITAYASIDTAIQAMRAGAADYLPKPFTPAQVKLVTRRIAELRKLEQKVATLQDSASSAPPETDFASTTSPAMQRAIHLAQQVATTDATVLIRGESGTGKGVLVRAIHNWSARKDHPLATVACPSLSPELLESELFGHIKGSFTSALRDNPGRIAAADGGTLFLDEIGDLPISIQPKLLRFIQDREYERVGEQVTRKADIRVITATNVNLEKAVAEGRFREDLLYRLNVIQIELPPLRDRKDDIVPMAERMLAFFTRNKPKKVLGFSPEAANVLRSHQWPGNIRELRNVIERCAILAATDTVTPELLPGSLGAPIVMDPLSADAPLITLDKLEELYIRRVLAQTKSLEDAAATLGIDTATLWRRRKKYRI
ncbi:MAG TPA: sigma-54 dependent transcriptional regulator [Phycisphaerae bacterium]|jgi:NtrC-family two-component system response regulator AlgB|nr:sigma-54 dependent transcriptional regulator [Phycisphaerae bacterium]